jgi:hypothetical protein
MSKVRNSPRPATFQSGDCKVAISGHVMSRKNGTGVQRCASNPKETEKWPLSAMSRAVLPTKSSPIWSRACARG